MTNIFFQSQSILSNTTFKLRIHIINAVDLFVNFVHSYIYVVTKPGPYPKTQLINTLRLLCYARLNPQDVATTVFVNTIIGSIGLPTWFIHLTHLLPSGSIGLKGVFTISLDSDISSENADNLKSTFQTDLLQIRSYYISAGLPYGFKYDIHSNPSKKTDITVLFDPHSYFNKEDDDLDEYDLSVVPDFSKRKDEYTFYFPSSEGFHHSLTWLFSLLFLPHIIAGPSSRRDITDDYVRFASLNFKATIQPIVYQGCVQSILYWYFNGNVVVQQQPKGNPSPPRNTDGSLPTKQSNASKQPQGSTSTGGTQPKVVTSRPSPTIIKQSNESLNFSDSELFNLFKSLVRETVKTVTKNRSKGVNIEETDLVSA